jgi:hypothetical protein
MPSNSKELVGRLADMKMVFSAETVVTKTAILRELERLSISNLRLLEKYHETLCFMQAYPDNASVLKLVDNELAVFEHRVARLRDNPKMAGALDDTGIMGTTIRYPYGLRMAKWLHARYGRALELDWDSFNEKSDDPLSGLLPMFALYLENDGIDDEDLITSDWVKMAVGKRNSFAWFIDHFDKTGMPFEAQQYIYDNAGLMLKWDLTTGRGSRTLAKTQPGKIFFQRKPLAKLRIDLGASVRRKPPELKILNRRMAEEKIETLISALLPRLRELWPATFANPDEVYVTSPGRGLDIHIFGMIPRHRMPLESNYAALIIKNGVPIGYGISVLFFDRCEIAINVFESFRSGEASLIFEHFVRIFYHHFGGRNFLMRRWQLGYENHEGIKSGSFWFYYKMGFRSLDTKTDRLAQEEWLKITADKNYRTREMTLKRLARSDMHIALGHAGEKPYTELRVTRLAFAITKMIAERFDGNRQKALKHVLIKIKDASLSPAGLSAAERPQYERFAPLLMLIDDLPSWSRTDKKGLLEIIKAKALPREIEYIRRLQSHKRFEAALKKLADKD